MFGIFICCRKPNSILDFRFTNYDWNASVFAGAFFFWDGGMGMHWHADDADGADWGLIFIVEFLIVGQRPHRTRKAVDKPLLANTYASWGEAPG